MLRSTLNGLTSLGFIAISVLASPALAQTAMSQDSNIAGIVAESIECKRADGVLSARMRLRNTSPADMNVTHRE